MGCFKCDKLGTLPYTGISICGIKNKAVDGFQEQDWDPVPEWCPKLKKEEKKKDDK